MEQDGEVLDVFLQVRKDGKATKCFFRHLLKLHGAEPRKIVTDKLRSFGVAHREPIPEAIPTCRSMRTIKLSYANKPRGNGTVGVCANSNRACRRSDS